VPCSALYARTLQNAHAVVQGVGRTWWWLRARDKLAVVPNDAVAVAMDMVGSRNKGKPGFYRNLCDAKREAVKPLTDKPGLPRRGRADRHAPRDSRIGNRCCINPRFAGEVADVAECGDAAVFGKFVAQGMQQADLQVIQFAQTVGLGDAVSQGDAPYTRINQKSAGIEDGRTGDVREAVMATPYSEATTLYIALPG